MADYEEEKAKIKKKNKKLTLTGAGPSPIRMLARHMDNKRRKKTQTKELAALPMKVDDFQEDHEMNRIKNMSEDFAKQVRKEVGIKEPKTKGMKFERVKKMKLGGEAVPSKFKGFSKLPEGVQQKIDPKLASKYEMGGKVEEYGGGGKVKGGKMSCRGMGAALRGGGYTIS
tara:strand:- start:551 stop:1063 length:513 start_codon:yes stop_codon:yes gene_type:complete